jgi:hypothetical protein
MSRYAVLISGTIHEYDRYEDVPAEFDNLIAFEPSIPPGPHTEHQHDQINELNERLKELMRRERASRNKNR